MVIEFLSTIQKEFFKILKTKIDLRRSITGNSNRKENKSNE